MSGTLGELLLGCKQCSVAADSNFTVLTSQFLVSHIYLSSVEHQTQLRLMGMLSTYFVLYQKTTQIQDMKTE